MLPELALRNLVRALSLQRILNFFKVELSFWLSKRLRRPIVWGRPYILTVEPASYCNLNCPFCVVGAKKLTRNSGFLDFDVYQQLINELGDDLIEILLFNQGEPFLNPGLVDFIKLAKRKKIYTVISTNGHFLDDKKMIQNLINSGLDVLIVSLDGTTSESYQKYRRGGDFQRVLAGLQLLQQIKRECASDHPKLFLQFLMMRHNIHEMPRVRSLARQLGAERILFKTLQVNNPTTDQQFLPTDPKFCRYRVNQDRLETKRQPDHVCGRLWRSSVLLSDSRVVGCCFDKNGDFALGQLTTTNSFQLIWQAPKYQQFRQRILQQYAIGDLCSNCSEGIKIYYE